MKTKAGIVICALSSMSALAQAPALKASSPKRLGRSSKFKVIWESVPLGKDIDLIKHPGFSQAWPLGGAYR